MLPFFQQDPIQPAYTLLLSPFAAAEPPSHTNGWQLTTTLFLKAFEDAGFYGIRLDRWESKPYRTVEGIEFRSVTVTARKGKQGPCFERNQAVIYKGPWKKVFDDDGHALERGRRMAVCDKTFNLYSRPPYKDDLILIPPLVSVPVDEARAFDCHGPALRSPRETKGANYRATDEAGSTCCGPDGCS